MSPRFRWLPSAAAAVLLASCGEATPKQEPTVVSAATDTVVAPYTSVTRALPLGGERWAIMAPSSSIVALVDFGTDSVRRLGDTVKTLRNPATAFTIGDTLYLGDWGLRKITKWSREGALLDTLAATSLVGGGLPRGRDAAGHFYVEIAANPDPRSKARDSTPVVRTGSALNRGDTVAWLSPPDLAAVRGDASGRFEPRVFSGRDQWGALDDGSVWVARVHHNRVDWRAPDGTWTKGQALPDRVLEVTRYDREMFIRTFPPELRAMAQQLSFAPVKPPFEDAFTASNGLVWLVKSRAPTDSAGRYHVVGRDGRLIREIHVPGRGRVIGASERAIVVMEPTRGGVRLLRFAVPPLPQVPAAEQ